MDYQEHRKVQKTKEILQNYVWLKEYRANLEDTLEEQHMRGQNMITAYNEHIGRSSEERLNPGAILAFDADHQKTEYEFKVTKIRIDRIDRALNLLPKIEKVIIERRYIDPKPMPWYLIEETTGYCEKQCRRLEKRALGRISVAIYGMRR